MVGLPGATPSKKTDSPSLGSHQLSPNPQLWSGLLCPSVLHAGLWTDLIMHRQPPLWAREFSRACFSEVFPSVALTLPLPPLLRRSLSPGRGAVCIIWTSICAWASADLSSPLFDQVWVSALSAAQRDFSGEVREPHQGSASHVTEYCPFWWTSRGVCIQAFCSCGRSLSYVWFQAMDAALRLSYAFTVKPLPIFLGS